MDTIWFRPDEWNDEFAGDGGRNRGEEEEEKEEKEGREGGKREWGLSLFPLR